MQSIISQKKKKKTRCLNSKSFFLIELFKKRKEMVIGSANENTNKFQKYK